MRMPLALAGVLLCACLPAKADSDFMTAKQFNEYCAAANDDPRSLTCTIYAMGAIDGMTFSSGGKQFCTPTRLSYGTMIGLVHDYYIDHDVDGARAAVSVIAEALTATFPCLPD